MDVIFFQTSDPLRYRRMLDATSRTVAEYCRRFGYAYESYVGIKRGFHAWQASFNRIYQFKELINRGFSGWAIYLDADAYIFDLDFDLRRYLEDKSQFAGVMTTIAGSSEPWNINSGVILLNLGSPYARQLVDDWMARFMSLSLDCLRKMTEMQEYDNDQQMLWLVLNSDKALREAIFYENYEILNSMNALFVRQHLRAFVPSVEERTRSIEVIVDELLGSVEGEDATVKVAPSVIAALYRALLHRDPDEAGLIQAAMHLRKVGLERGTAEVIGDLLGSEEYRRLRAG